MDKSNSQHLNYQPDSGRCAQILSDFIQCKTISEKGYFQAEEIQKFHNILKKWFPNLMANAEWLDFDGGIMLKWQGKHHDKPLALMSHMDVVSAVGEWKKPPFSGEICDGVVWGRGAVDTKGPLSAIFEAVESLAKEGYQPCQDVYILSSSKEEIGGADAELMAKWFVDRGIKPALLIDEGGAIVDAPIAGVDGKFAMLGMVERSSARIILEAQSDKYFAAQEKLAQFVLSTKGVILGKRDFTPETLAMFSAMYPQAKGTIKFVLGRIKFFKPLMLKLLPKMNPAATSLIGATFSFCSPLENELQDMLPSRARLVARISGNYYNSLTDLITQFESIVKKAGLTSNVVSKRETPRPEPLGSKGFLYVKKALNDIMPDVIAAPFAVLGGTDARHFIGIAESVIRFAPIYLNKQQFGSFHNLNENLNISSVTQAVMVYRKIVLDYSNFL